LRLLRLLRTPRFDTLPIALAVAFALDRARPRALVVVAVAPETCGAFVLPRRRA
jgi:hypothetical protein